MKGDKSKQPIREPKKKVLKDSLDAKRAKLERDWERLKSEAAKVGALPELLNTSKGHSTFYLLSESRKKKKLTLELCGLIANELKMLKGLIPIYQKRNREDLNGMLERRQVRKLDNGKYVFTGKGPGGTLNRKFGHIALAILNGVKVP